MFGKCLGLSLADVAASDISSASRSGIGVSCVSIQRECCGCYTGQWS